jgi:hypothetical protein
MNTKWIGWPEQRSSSVAAALRLSISFAFLMFVAIAGVANHFESWSS